MQHTIVLSPYVQPCSADGALVLVAEQNAALQRHLHKVLKALQYRVVLASTFEGAMIEIRSRAPDVMLMDLALLRDGEPSTMAKIRANSSAPVVVLYPRGSEKAAFALLQQGADDCLAKPWETEELVARLGLAYRRASPASALAVSQPVRSGELSIDLASRRVTRTGISLRLTPIEYKVLAVLAKRVGMTVPSREILTDVWGANFVSQSRYLRVYMVHLRKKIEPSPASPRHLVTEPGIGYRLEAQ